MKIYENTILKYCLYKLKNIIIYFKNVKKYSIISFNIKNINCYNIGYFLSKYNIKYKNRLIIVVQILFKVCPS